MRSDDSIPTGSHDQWQWIVAREMIRDLPLLTSLCHNGDRLCITAFDSGPISPSPDETSIGWSLIGDVMISPPLNDTIDIPCAEHDEWYVFPSVPTNIEFGKRYVNYLGFTLADPQQLAAIEDPMSWTSLDWLIALQLEFWRDIERLKPISYISSGDYDIIVTRNSNFAERVLSAARKQTG
jgi:hypothetical protein